MVTPMTVKYDKTTGTFDLSPSLSGELHGNDIISFSANIPIRADILQSKIITILDSLTTCVQDDFFHYPVTQISTSNQSYIIGDFVQDTIKGTITFTNGCVLARGQVLRVQR